MIYRVFHSKSLRIDNFLAVFCFSNIGQSKFAYRRSTTYLDHQKHRGQIVRIDKPNPQPPLTHLAPNNVQLSVNSGTEKTSIDSTTAPSQVPNIRTHHSQPPASNPDDAQVGGSRSTTQSTVGNIEVSTQYLRSLISGQSEVREQRVQAIKLKLSSGELTTPQAAYETAKSILDE
jgi:anti-sigma28 factor (negative regulator of flagellin synthesis)